MSIIDSAIAYHVLLSYQGAKHSKQGQILIRKIFRFQYGHSSIGYQPGIENETLGIFLPINSFTRLFFTFFT